MPRSYASTDRVDHDALLEFVRPRHKVTLVTTRNDGRPQLSPVSAGVDDEGRIVISTYPQRAKVTNLRRRPECSVLVHSDEWNGPYVQVDGTAEVIDLPDSVEPLVDYFRSISGEHPDWDEYRQAMRDQGKSLIRITVERWGPIATGGSRPSRTERSEVLRSALHVAMDHHAAAGWLIARNGRPPRGEAPHARAGLVSEHELPREHHANEGCRHRHPPERR